MNNNQTTTEQTNATNGEELTPRKRKKKSSGEYNKLYSELGKIVVGSFPLLEANWQQGNEADYQEGLRQVELVLCYAHEHPRFVSSLKQGLLK